MGENPPGLPEDNPDRYLYFFIHNVFANFFRDSLDYFAGHLYPRFEHRVVATYDKAVEYLTKKDQYGREIDKPQLPALILNPSGEFELADAIAGGKQTWRFPNLDPGLATRIFLPVYADSNVQVNVGFIRIQGDIELLMLLNSFYEYCDLRMLFLQIFAGFERWIYPQYFTTFIILPEELVNYEYSNPVTGVKYKLNWESAGAYERLVRTTAKNELVLPCNIKPIYKLTGFSDVSQRYGGTDKLADWRLGATIKYEIEVPAWLLLISNYLPQSLSMEVKAGSVYSEYDFEIPTRRWYNDLGRYFPHLAGADDSTSTFSITTYNSDSNADPSVQATMDSTCVMEAQVEYNFNTRYFHIITEADAKSTVDIQITLPEPIFDMRALIVNSKNGPMTYGDHYYVTKDGKTLVIRVDTVTLVEGEIIELYVYTLEYKGP